MSSTFLLKLQLTQGGRSMEQNKTTIFRMHIVGKVQGHSFNFRERRLQMFWPPLMNPKDWCTLMFRKYFGNELTIYCVPSYSSGMRLLNPKAKPPFTFKNIQRACNKRYILITTSKYARVTEKSCIFYSETIEAVQFIKAKNVWWILYWMSK